MKLLRSISLRGSSGKRIDLCQGDLTLLAADEGFDLLVVSAFPNDYVPTSTSLVGALHRKGLSVAALAADKETDIRQNFSCWLSRAFTPSQYGLRFSRLLCFEPLTRGDPPAVVSDIFRALTPILAEKEEITTVAVPIVAAGDQGYSVTEMLEPLLDAAIHWMEHGLPLQVLTIVVYRDAQAHEARDIFEKKALAYARSNVRASEPAADFRRLHQLRTRECCGCADL